MKSRLFVTILVAIAIALQIISICIAPGTLLPLRLVTLVCMVMILILNIRRCVKAANRREFMRERWKMVMVRYRQKVQGKSCA